MACCVRSTNRDTMDCRGKNPREEARLPVNKVTWQQVGHVTEPGRYMFRFGWLTIAADDLAIWTQFPDASFTLVQTSAPALEVVTEAADKASPAETDEFHLGAFQLHTDGDFHVLDVAAWLAEPQSSL
jgi:hypothetical protein